ncbi:MAG: hypothetical protein WCL21_10910 [Mariniphaga sp.]
MIRIRHISLVNRRISAFTVPGIVFTMTGIRRIFVGLLITLFLSSFSNAYGQCPPTITADCLGNGQFKLTSSDASTWLWNTGATDQYITVPGAGIYTVTVTGSGCTSSNNAFTINVGDDQVVNGNFSAGNTGFLSQYTHTSNGRLDVGGLPPNFAGEGLYEITTNAHNTHSNFWGYDHTHSGATASQPYLAVNGNPSANKIVWMQTVSNIQPNTNYYFSVYTMSLNDVDPFAELQLNINNNAIVPSYVLTAGVNSINNPWYHYYTIWNSGSTAGSIPISITDLQTALGGNDFALDDISFSQLNPVPLTPGTTSITVCAGSSINLFSPVKGGSAPFTYVWKKPDGTIFSSVQNPQAIVATNGTYTVTVTDLFKCQQNGTVNVTVTSGITLTTTPNVTVCAGTPVNLTSSPQILPNDILLSENFNNPTNNWTAANTSSGGTPDNAAWTLHSSPYSYGGTTFQSKDNSQFYLTNSQAQNRSNSTTHTELISPTINTLGYSTLQLSFWQYYRDGNNNEAYVDVWNGTSWINVATYNSTLGNSNPFNQNPVLNLNAYKDIPNLKIRFRYQATNDYYWAIDNVTLTGSFAYNINWTSVPLGFTSSLANPGIVTPLATTTYTVIYTHPATGCSESKQIVVTVSPAATITSQPTDFSACTGEAKFTVAAMAAGTPTYAWEYSTAGVNGPWNPVPNTFPPYSGITSDQLTISLIAPAMNGYYFRSKISYGICPSVYSNPAKLNVTGVSPVITGPPATISKCVGDNASFTVVSDGQNFQWQESTNGGSTFTDVTNIGQYSGATTATLNISAVTIASPFYEYKCKVWISGCGSTITSNPANLEVYSYPTINPQPLSATICSNAIHTFTITASGSTGYQWQENSGAGWADISDGGIYSGSLNQSLTLTTVPDTYNGYQYQCVASNASCTTTSTAATLSITSPPVISVQPDNAAICEGDPVVFSLTAISTGTLSYQWKNSIDNGTTWNNIGTISFSPTLTTTNGIGGTQYQCIVTDNCGQPVTSDIVTLTYLSKPVTTPPLSATVCALSACIFSVDALPGVTYLWQVSADNGANWVNLTNDVWGEEFGVRSSELFVWPPKIGHNGYQYRCMLTLTGGCSNPSGPATLTVNPMPVAPTTATVDHPSFCPGAFPTITLTASGGTGTTVNWYTGSCKGVSLKPTGNPLTITAPAVTTTYYASNVNDCGISECASVTVNILAAPTAPTSFTTGGKQTSYCSNDKPSGTYRLTAVGARNATGFDWYKDFPCEVGTPLLTHGVTLSLIPTPATTTTYYVRSTNSTCSPSACTSITITVDQPHSISLTSPTVTTSQTVCRSSSISNITYAVGGGATGATITGLPTGVTGIYSSGVFTISGAPATSGTFSYTVTTTGSGVCASVAASGNIYINAINPGTIKEGAKNHGPGCATLNPNTAGSFLNASGNGTLTYSWEQSTDNQISWQPANGNTSTGYESFNPAPMDVTTSLRRVATYLWNGSSCHDYSNVLTYTVYPLPVVNPIQPPPPASLAVCVNSQITLWDTTPGGVWSTADASLATVSGGVVTGVGPGTVLISYTITEAVHSCSKTVNRTVTINPLPTTSAIYHQ